MMIIEVNAKMHGQPTTTKSQELKYECNASYKEAADKTLLS